MFFFKSDFLGGKSFDTKLRQKKKFGANLKKKFVKEITVGRDVEAWTKWVKMEVNRSNKNEKQEIFFLNLDH